MNAPNTWTAWLRRVALPVCAAFLVGLFSVAPHIIAPHLLGADNQGIPFLYSDDEDFYLARMREFLDHHPTVGSPFLLEYKNQWTLQAPIPELWMYVFPATVLRLPLEHYLILANFLFPALLFLLIYRLTRSITQEFLTSHEAIWSGLVAGMLTTLGYEFLALQSWLGLLHGTLPPLSLSVWVRPVNPISGAILLFALLNVLWVFYRRPGRRWAIIAGAIWMLMIGYVFSWAVGLAAIAFLGVTLALHRRWKDVRLLLITLGMGILAAGLYGWKAITSQAGVEGDDALQRNGLLLTHAPIWNKFILAATIAFLIMTVRSVWKNGWRSWRTVPGWWWFTATMLVAGNSAYLQQVITGRTIWFHHFVQYTKPIALIAFVVGFSWLLRERHVLRRAICGLMIAGCVINGGMLASNVGSRLDAFRGWQKEAPMFSWLDENASKDCVVLVQEAGEWRSLFIPAFTHCNVYSTSYLLMKLPTERIRHMYFVGLRLKGLTPETLPAFLDKHDRNIRGLFYDSWETMFADGHDPWYDAMAADLTKGYAEFYKRPFADALRDYQIDYLWTDHELSDQEKEVYGAAGPVFQSDGGGWMYVM